MDGCLSERFVVVDDFLPEEKSLAMRADIDAHFADPHKHQADSHQVWNYWHVPGAYNYLRTTPDKVIARDKVQFFVDSLRNWAALNLGLAGVTWPYLSLYVPGCGQAIHNDSVNGRFGFVYSLTRNARATIGGETMVFQDRDLFRGALDKAAAGSDLYDLVAPRFNRLTLFDDRVPHGVQRIDGSMDPVEGRLVLHGHIREAGVIVQGALAPEAIRPLVDELLEQVRGTVAKEARGPLVLCIEIAASGEVQRLRPIVDRLATSGEADLDKVRAAVAERFKALRFPAASAPTNANIPLTF